MNQKIDDKIALIKDVLQTKGLKVVQKEQILRTRLNNQSIVDIFPLKKRPDQIRARLKVEEPDPHRRQAYVEATYHSLADVLKESVKVNAFCLSRETDDACIYSSALELRTPNRDDVPIEINEEAIEIIEDEAPAADPESVCFTDSEEDDASGDLAQFELDFSLEQDNRIKVVKSLAEEALENLETVDSKTLRQSLDMMGLKRSSAVRLAVTRIFRSALEVEELEKTVQDEAARISSVEDRAELQEVKSMCGNSFLEPVINMLWQEVFKDAP